MRTNLECLDNIEGYRDHFMDTEVWEPYVRQVCSSLGDQQTREVKPGLAGTYPTFIVGQQWVVKFFGQLFDGQESFWVEKTVTRLVLEYEPFPCPSIIAEGQLFPGELDPWLYLIYAYFPGESIGKQLDKIPDSEKEHFAGWLGERVRLLHEIPVAVEDLQSLPKQQTLDNSNIQDCINRQIEYGDLPYHLIDQIGSYLEATCNLNHFKLPHHLIHADITADHILGEVIGTTWKTNAIIDYGDAMFGNLAYEINAIYLDLFHRQKFMLREFLSGYGNDRLSCQELPLAGLRMTLLHRFKAFGFLTRGKLNKANCPDLFTLADQLWNIETPDSGLF